MAEAPPDWGHALLRAAVGARLVGVARAHYEERGRVDDAQGPLELEFAGARVLRLDTAANGESVWVRPGPWVDPLLDPEADEDPDPANEHGRWVRVDARNRPGYAQVVGRALDGVRWLANERGSVGGVELAFGLASLTFVSWGDDEYVFPGGAAAVPAEWGFRPVAPPDPPTDPKKAP